MDALVLAYGMPFPTTAGAAWRTVGVIDALASLGRPGVVAVAPAATDRGLADLQAAVPAFGVCATLDHRARLAAAVSSVVGRSPVQVAEASLARVTVSRLRSSIAASAPSLLVTNMGSASGLVPADAWPRTILNLCDADIEYWESVRALSQGGRRVAASLQLRAARRWYPSIYQKARAVIVPCEEDALAIRHVAPTASVVVIPSYAGSPALSAPTGEWSPQLLFHAGAARRNLGSLQRILDDVLPVVRGLRPDANLVVAGAVVAAAEAAGGTLWARLSGDSGIACRPRFDTLLEISGRGTVAIEPIEEAAGTKLKVAQSCLAGLPVVALHAGWRGLDEVRRAAGLPIPGDLPAAGRAIAALLDPIPYDRASTDVLAAAARLLDPAVLRQRWASCLAGERT